MKINGCGGVGVGGFARRIVNPQVVSSTLTRHTIL